MGKEIGFLGWKWEVCQTQFFGLLFGFPWVMQGRLVSLLLSPSKKGFPYFDSLAKATLLPFLVHFWSSPQKVDLLCPGPVGN